MLSSRDPLTECTGFDRDDGNEDKNWSRHQVTSEEAEDISFNAPPIIRSDVGHSRREKRYFALGQTDRARRLFAAFAIRGNLIRVISIRDMNLRERDAYEKHEERYS